ncbi:MAG: hypothetical protein M1816_002264 [Peltula sp. TS41687]|nr:MAG: hypothetical protein M1816_002264 [Peltula sp. TS41687]
MSHAVAYKICRGPGKDNCDVPAGSRYPPYDDIMEEEMEKFKAGKPEGNTNTNTNNNNALSLLLPAAFKKTRNAVMGRLDAAGKRLGSALNKAEATSNIDGGTPQMPVGMGELGFQPEQLR